MSFTTVLSALALAAVLPVTASPTSKPSTFSLMQVAGGTHFKNAPLDMARVYKKFNKSVPSNIAAAASSVQSGSVSANPEAYDESYLCPVTIGTPGTTLMLDFDTGSSDLWVFSNLQSAKQQKGHSIYSPNASSTSTKQTGETWDISYGDGSGASGVVYADTVKVGGVTATSQAVEAATSISEAFIEDTDNDGLLGLGFPNINTCSPKLCTPFVQTVLSSLPAQVFTADLKHAQAGSYDFGFINSTKYTGDITYAPVNTANGYWEFAVAGYSVGTKSYKKSIDAIMDTGTTLIYLPSGVIKNYYAKVTGSKNSAAAGGWIFPCSATLPDLSINIKGVSHTVPGSYINYAPYSGSNCYGGLQSSSGVGISILGDVFMKSQFVVFDVGNTRLGVASQSES